MSLLDRLKKSGSVKLAETMDESDFFNVRDFTTTESPAINIGLSGDIDGGLSSGLTIIAGPSKSFKTCMSLYMLSAYLKKYPDAVCLYYDSEFGSTPTYLKRFKIDTSRVLHIPIEHVEQLKFDLTKRLDEIKRGDKVFIFIDSIGNLASKKEIEDAQNEKSVADMTRAKAIRSFFRILTPNLTTKDIPCVCVAHTYETMELYSKAVVSGGTAVMYSANTVWIISRAMEKDGTELVGFRFTINIEKSRFVKEKSKIPLTVLFDGGINYGSGLVDIALEGGYIAKPSNGWYQLVDRSTGELVGGKMRLGDFENDKEFWHTLFDTTDFKSHVKKVYTYEAEV